MEFWSSGLGSRESLDIPCGRETVEPRDGAVALQGTTRAPVRWSYTMTMTADDFSEFLDLALSARVLGIVVRRPVVLARAGAWLLWFLVLYVGACAARKLRSIARRRPRRAASEVQS